MTQNGGTLPEFSEAPDGIPAPMDLEQAQRLARRIYGFLGAARKAGDACIVGVRRRKGSHKIDDIGMGATWEKAFDVALRNEGR